MKGKITHTEVEGEKVRFTAKFPDGSSIVGYLSVKGFALTDEGLETLADEAMGAEVTRPDE